MGIVLDRRRSIAITDMPLLLGLEMRLPERVIPLRAMARPVWTFGTQQAFHFVRISDVDRLTIAEHLDLLCMRGDILN
jgi:hypothetical protein